MVGRGGGSWASSAVTPHRSRVRQVVTGMKCWFATEFMLLACLLAGSSSSSSRKTLDGWMVASCSSWPATAVRTSLLLLLPPGRREYVDSSTCSPPPPGNLFLLLLLLLLLLQSPLMASKITCEAGTLPHATGGTPRPSISTPASASRSPKKRHLDEHV